MQTIYIKFLRLFALMCFCLLALQTGRADWLHDLKKVDTQRDSLFNKLEPGFLIRPLSARSTDIVAKHYARERTLIEKGALYESLVRTAIMHPRTHFFEHSRALMPVEDLTACYIIHTATQILEGANSVKTIPELAKNLLSYFQALLLNKETALQTLVADKDLISKILEVLATHYVTESDYRKLLTDEFINWYQGVSTSCPKERLRNGIRLENLPPPARETLEITFRDGLYATYREDEGAFFFYLDGTRLTTPKGISYNNGKIVYYETTLDLSLPLSSLQKNLDQIGARATLKREDLRTLLFKKTSNLYENIVISPSSDLNQIIKDRSESLEILDVYRVFGCGEATESVAFFENGLGTALSLKGAKVAPIEQKESLFNEAFELLEHSAQSKSEKAPEAKNNLSKILHDSVSHLYIGGGLDKDNAPYDKSVSLLRKSIGLLKKAKEMGYTDTQETLSIVEHKLGLVIAEKTMDNTLPHSKKIELFEECISLLKKANASKTRNVKMNLAKIYNSYGCYLFNNLVGKETLSPEGALVVLRKTDGAVSSLKKIIDLFKEAKELEAANAEKHLAIVENILNLLLSEKGGA